MNEKCQIFTPENYVEELLESINYKHNLYGKSILENACGDGNILIAIVKRYIEDCKERNLSRTKIRKGLGRDIYGVEIDKKYYEQCLTNLNQITDNEDIGKVKWQLFNEDYLKIDIPSKFDYVVSNPPYITYSELKVNERVYLKERFETCKEGKCDYCYAFIEKSFKSLKHDGKMSYLIPSSIFKTVFGKKLRELIKLKVVKILDYTTEKVFDDVLVASAILVLDKSNIEETIEYTDVVSGKSILLYSSKLGDKWIFSNKILSGDRRFGKFFKVTHSVATLLNEAFVIKEWIDDPKIIQVENYQIEKEVIRNTASPRMLSYEKKEKIIFPYYYEDGILMKYNEEEFEINFPGATAYLNKFREKLNNRKKDVSAKWFEYGRSQALSSIEQNKLLISTVITNEVKVYRLDKHTIPYAGMFIVPISNDLNLDDAIVILTSQQFLEYVNTIGIHINGESLRITSKDILDFTF